MDGKIKEMKTVCCTDEGNGNSVNRPETVPEVNLSRKTFESDESTFENAMAFIDESAVKANLTDKARRQVRIAFEEMYINVCHYAYEGQKGEIEISAGNNGEFFEIKIADGGKYFNPLEMDDPDITKSAEEREIGGLGIFMVKKLMDGMYYSRVTDKNVLLLFKKI